MTQLLQAACKARRYPRTRSARRNITATQPRNRCSARNMHRDPILPPFIPTRGVLPVLRPQFQVAAFLSRVCRLVRCVLLALSIVPDLRGHRLRHDRRRLLRARLLIQQILQVRQLAYRPVQIARITVQRSNVLLLVRAIRDGDRPRSDRAFRRRILVAVIVLRDHRRRATTIRDRPHPIGLCALLIAHRAAHADPAALRAVVQEWFSMSENASVPVFSVFFAASASLAIIAPFRSVFPFSR
ncbi:hypothetical protein [Caballeronia sp. EK]|uniref:hypothetical protein n=1 Tax=Caballeronia sp. EK TaxID=2767469 RepID=UPI002102185F|nr:hypothetical protein [Caballeronia sp. EK]